MEQARARKLRRLLKSFFSVALCCVLVVAYSYKKPVKADAVLAATVTVAGYMAVAAAATALGIGVGAAITGQSYQQTCQNIWNGISDTVKNQITLTNLAVQDGMAKVVLTQQFLKEVFNGFKAQFTQAPSTSYIAGAFTAAQLAKTVRLPFDVTNIYNGFNLSNYYNLSYVGTYIFSSASNFLGQKVTVTLPYTACTVYIDGTVSNPQFVTKDNSTNWTFNRSIRGYNYTSIYSIDGSNPVYIPASSIWQVYYAFRDLGGVTYPYFFMTDSTTGQTMDFITGSSDAVLPGYEGQDVFNPTMEDLFAEGYSTLVNKIDDVINKLKERVGDVDGNIPVTVPADSDIADQQTRTQADTVGKDIATETDKTADDTYNDTNNKDTTIPKSSSMPKLLLPTGLQKKFPFCLPWDLAACYKLFQVAPKAPVWTIPINIDQGALQVHQTYTYDLNSNHVMDTALPIFKWFVNIGFVLMLIAITRKIME